MTLNGDVGYIVCSGLLSERVVARFRDELRNEQRLVNYVFMDCSAITDVDPGARVPGLQVLEKLKAMGTAKVFSFSDSTTVRMLASAMSFAVGLHMRFLADKPAAIAALDAALALPPKAPKAQLKKPPDKK